MNLRDSRCAPAYAAMRKKGLVTRLAINRLNLLNDSRRAKPRSSAGQRGSAWGTRALSLPPGRRSRVVRQVCPRKERAV